MIWYGSDIASLCVLRERFSKPLLLVVIYIKTRALYWNPKRDRNRYSTYSFTQTLDLTCASETRGPIERDILYNGRPGILQKSSDDKWLVHVMRVYLQVALVQTICPDIQSKRYRFTNGIIRRCTSKLLRLRKGPLMVHVTYLVFHHDVTFIDFCMQFFVVATPLVMYGTSVYKALFQKRVNFTSKYQALTS